MHLWGSKWFEENGEDLNDAIDFIHTNLQRWGRLWCSSKEKYGTARISVYFSHISWLGPYQVLRKYQEWVYAIIYLCAIKKWPHLREEILCCADWPELFPIEVCREAHKDSYRSADPGDLVYIPHTYTMYRAVVNGETEYPTVLVLQRPEGGYYYTYKDLYRHWDGCGIS